MRHPAAMMIRMSFAIAAVAASLTLANHSAFAQGYFVDGRPASVAEVHYLTSRGIPAGNWRIDGWGIGPAAGGPARQAQAISADSEMCHYVLGVPLGHCEDTAQAIAQNDAGSVPVAAAHVQRAAADEQGELEHRSSLRDAAGE